MEFPRAKKKFGQNFLIDQNILRKIISLTNPSNKIIFEIGPGTGQLSKFLIEQKPNCIYAFEIDPDMISFLINSNFYNYNILKIFETDFLKINLNNFILENKISQKIEVVANLPYYISSKIIFKLIENDTIVSLSIMLQKELVDRIVSKPSSKDYGRFTVAVNSFFQTEDFFIVKPNAFLPVPKVDSAFIKLKRTNYDIPNQKEYLDFVKMSFSNRRKQLLNNLKVNQLFYNITKQYLQKNNYSTQSRAENLLVNDFILIWKEINETTEIG